MKFALDDVQQSLQDATKDFLSKRSTSDLIRKAIVEPHGYDKELFSSLCNELGLASLVVPEQYGGFGASDVEVGVVFEQLGYYLAPTPLRTHIFAQIALLECASEEFLETHLSRLVSGQEIATVMFDDELRGVDLDNLDTLYGVIGGLDADHLYLFLGENHDLVYIDLSQQPIERNMLASIDQTIPLATINLNGANHMVISDEKSRANYRRARSRATVALSNEMVGSAQAVLDASVEYAKDRVQFGRPIGSFQAIKHKCADMLLETESARSIALYASWIASQNVESKSDDLQENLDHVASMAKYYCSKTLSHGAGENIQIHGGIGFTMEHDAQLYFKRAAFMNAYLGLPSDHSKLLATDIISHF